MAVLQYMVWLCGNILKTAIFGVFWTLSTDFSHSTGNRLLELLTAGKPRYITCHRTATVTRGGARTFRTGVYAVLSLRLYLSPFSSLEYSEIRNSSSVAIVEMFSTGQVTIRASRPYYLW
ncbi:hypothetical protein L873DRAFT_1802517 [Choiromyces venosus 120613-1]|uniref:Uncharacterized protein n=1 Tax=Choiromyces venosus 120613-1 TaxID=1336337 RepID=A0A3N4K821_9PEZI|nr:hypothetical protein L873DRAFT_1802517 [Choiromyces venosus 120613-1]